MWPGRGRTALLVLLLPVAAGALPVTDDGALGELTSLRVQLGLRDTEPTPWAGTIRIEPGRIVAVAGLNFEQNDRCDVDGTFALRTRRQPPTNAAQRARGRANMPMQANGFDLTVAGATANSTITLTVGDQTATAPYPIAGGLPRLQGAVRFDAAAPALEVVGTPDYEDLPAATTTADGTVYCVYLSFTPAEAFRRRGPMAERPTRFDNLAEPPGADRLWLAARRAGTWSAPVPVTAGGLDLYRPAVAVDGQGRVWVFWSQHVDTDRTFTDGDWELFARDMTPGAEQPAVRLTDAPGADVFPAAATDSAGAVQIAWMAFGGGDARILGTTCVDGQFGPQPVLADTPRDEWIPTLAAGADGRLALVWDSYGKGDYDVWARVRQGTDWGEPVCVAGSLAGEMNATAAFDAAGRLWVAYETTPPLWGKDFGALEKFGAPLFQGRGVACRVVAGDQILEPRQPLESAFGTAPGGGPRQGNPAALPRVGLDGAGRVWVTARVRVNKRVGAGSVWWTQASCYTGDAWQPAVRLSDSDAVLDNRPVLLPARGGLLVIASSDGRNTQGPAGGGPPNDDLRHMLVRAEAAGEPGLQPAAQPIVAPVAAPDNEPADVARMRAFRYTAGGATYQILRGEFHRHTEISPDGGGDGALLDMWRYGLNAADLDWIGNGDHDNGGGREYTWWMTQKTTTIFFCAPRFVPLFTYERSVNYPDGHRNVVFGTRGVRTLPRLQGGLGQDLDNQPADLALPPTADTLMLYDYLKQFGAICASHTSATDMGTDWRNNDPVAEPVVEIYQGDRQNYEAPGAPRSNKEGDSIGGWRPRGFVNLALKKGYRLGFQASSDHISTHMSYCNLLATEPTRAAMLEAFRARRCYGATDNIVADYRCVAGGREHLMGEEFATAAGPTLRVHLEGTQPFAKVVIIRDDEVVYTGEPNAATVDFEYTDGQPKRGATAYYYVRGEQADGELVWLSPMWIRVE